MAKDFDAAFRTMPCCLVGSACSDATSLDELLDCAQTELDLYEEGQDGTDDWSRRDANSVRRFLEKWRPSR